MQITFNFHLSRNDLQKHKFGHKNKLKANQCSKIKLQNVSQLSLHRLVPKCAVASDSNNVSELLSESLFLFAEKNNASETVRKTYVAQIVLKIQITVKV